MYRLLITQCDKPHNITGRKRYRVLRSYEESNDFGYVYISPLCGIVMQSHRNYRAGVFINPTKVLKEYLKGRSHGKAKTF